MSITKTVNIKIWSYKFYFIIKGNCKGHLAYGPLKCTTSPLLSLSFHTPPCTYSNNIVYFSASEQPQTALSILYVPEIAKVIQVNVYNEEINGPLSAHQGLLQPSPAASMCFSPCS